MPSSVSDGDVVLPELDSDGDVVLPASNNSIEEEVSLPTVESDSEVGWPGAVDEPSGEVSGPEVELPPSDSEDGAAFFDISFSAEYQVPDQTQVPPLAHHDFAEFCSVPRVLPKARARGMSGVLSLDLRTQWDFRQPAARRRSLELLERHTVGFLMLSPPCTAFSQLQSMLNYHRMQPARVQEIWGDGMLHFQHSMAAAVAQIQAGRHFAFEHPAGASSWGQQCVQDVKRDPSVMEIVFDQCMLGLCSKVHHIPMRKRTRIITNSRWMALQFSGLLCDGQHTHERIQGSEGGARRSTWAQCYPPLMVERIVFAVEHSRLAL